MPMTLGGSVLRTQLTIRREHLRLALNSDTLGGKGRRTQQLPMASRSPRTGLYLCWEGRPGQVSPPLSQGHRLINGHKHLSGLLDPLGVK